MRNPYMKFRNPSMHGSWQTDGQPETNMSREFLRRRGHNDIACQSVCFALTSSRYSKFGFEKKKNLHLVLKKKNCWGRIPGFHLSDKKKVYLWKLDYRGWVRGRHSDFSIVRKCWPFWKPVWLDWNWAIIHKGSRTYRNNAILSFDFIICQSEQFTIAIRLIFTHLIQMIADIHI